MGNASKPASGWTLTAADRQLAEAIRTRLPEIVFDVHAHPYRACNLSPTPALVEAGPAEAGADVWA